MDRSRSNRPFDIVVFGATSFAGQILCRYLVDRHGTDGELRWAIAARNPDKLSNVAAETGAEVEQLVADASDAEDMDRLASSGRVVVSTVGPYAMYGSKLVAAVAAAGTDYCDLTGEPHWMQQMIDAHSVEAEASGARVVHTCGVDSIPSDLGVLFTQQRAIETLGTHCTQIEMRVKAFKGGFSGGTIATMMNTMDELASDPGLRRVLANPYAIAPEGQRTGVRQPNVTTPVRDETSGQWLAPFVMASINTRVVHRSHALMGHPWGGDFLYDEALMMGRGPAGLARAAAMSAALAGAIGAAAIGPARSLLHRVLPDPGTGPTPEEQENGFFDIRFFGTTDDGRSIATRVTGDRDPGYGSTAKMLCEAAFALLSLDGVGGGFWTPATAFGESLIGPLEQHAGLTFEVLE
ncbi:MAG: saccharopine dehydrogenase NADP-binding domain-containing protein [Acidimicrobiia bacterium]|nr:saccharopine dehydrogenase NADP-binding domain-containing protein [Acidimicrobiia bacterium]